MKNVSIGAIGRSNGVELSIRAQLKNSEVATNAEKLLREGYAFCEKASQGVVGLALEAAFDSLSSSQLTKADIDGVIVTTESFWEDNLPDMPKESHCAEHLRLRESFLQKIVSDGGFQNACVYANSFSACGNGLNALSIGRSFILSGAHDNIMIVNADRLQFEHQRNKGAHFISDIATATVVSKSPGRMAVARQWSVPCAALTKLRREVDQANRSMRLMLACRDLKIKLDRKIGLKFSDYKAVIFENYGRSTIEIISRCLHIPREMVLTPSRERYGHAFSSDLFLSLRVLGREDKYSGEPMLLISIGTSSFGVAEVVFN